MMTRYISTKWLAPGTSDISFCMFLENLTHTCTKKQSYFPLLKELPEEDVFHKNEEASQGRESYEFQEMGPSAEEGKGHLVDCDKEKPEVSSCAEAQRTLCGDWHGRRGPGWEGSVMQWC